MPYPWVDMVLYFFIYSFCGWLMETVLCSVQEKHFVNRGFLNGPICPIYGCGILLILIFLLPVRDNIGTLGIAVPVIFFTGMVLASVVEYITSWLMEKLFRARWWDYSQYRFNLHGRICLWISLCWGGLATLFVYLVQPLFEGLIHTLAGWYSRLPLLLAVALLAVAAVDLLVSFRIARALGNKLEQMEKLGELIKAHLEGLSLPGGAELSKKLEAAYDLYEAKRHVLVERLQLKSLPIEKQAARIREKIDELKNKRDSLLKEKPRRLQKRMLSAFPHMRSASGSYALNELREALLRRRKPEASNTENKNPEKKGDGDDPRV